MTYLMDTINQAAERIRAARMVPTTQMMAAYADLGDRLQGTPRFLLDARACQMAVELNMGRPKVLREAMRYARVPYRRMWIEWNDADRQALRDKFSDEMEFAELRPMPGRIGVLLEADEAGRRGTAIWVDNPIQLEAFFDIWQTCEHKLAAWGPQYLTQFSDPQLAYALSRSDVVGEYIMLWCILLMLTASRPVVRYDAIDLGKVNKHRAKKRETPLLDHTRVTLNLAPHVERPVLRASYQHKSPRIHMVSSFLTTRHTREGTRHMIIQPYWRGQGEVIHRQVHVRG